MVPLRALHNDHPRLPEAPALRPRVGEGRVVCHLRLSGPQCAHCGGEVQPLHVPQERLQRPGPQGAARWVDQRRREERVQGTAAVQCDRDREPGSDDNGVDDGERSPPLRGQALLFPERGRSLLVKRLETALS